MNVAGDTLLAMFLHRAERSAEREALYFKRDGTFVADTWDVLRREVQRVAGGLIRQGLQPGDRVVQLAENRREWIVCDLAIQMAQGIHVPVHAPLTADQVDYQIRDSGTRIVLVSTAEQAAKLDDCAGAADCKIFAFDAEAPAACRVPIRSWDVLRDAVSPDEAARIERSALESLRPESLATMLYTSGTTGEPKGVMLTHRNLCTNTVGTLEAIGQRDEDVRLNFLPLSHVFARTCDLYTWICSGAQLALAESRETVVADCHAIRPTVLNGVPYFFDKVRRVLIEQGLADEPDALRSFLGGRVKYLCSGGAALADHVFDFYQQRGLPILQGYGLTETSPVISVSSLERVRRGASGCPIAGVEVRIAEDGEILTRGPHVMSGYYNKPDDTKDVIRDGWFHTGDLGHLDEDQFLYITGRKKEILVTSGGKNVAPVQLENLLTEDPLILQALVVGDRRDYLTALIVPDPDALREAIMAERIPVGSPSEALEHPGVVALYETRIAERLASVSRYEQVRKFRLLGRGFTIEQGEMTAKLSLRRAVIEEHFAAEIAALYE